MKTDILVFSFYLFSLIFFSQDLFGQKVYIDENISYWYKINSDLHINHNVYVKEDSAHIYLEINYNNQKIYDDYHYVYELHESYHTLDISDSDTLNIEDHILAIKANKIFAKFAVAHDDNTDLLIIRLTDKKTGIDYAYDIPMIENYNFSSDGLILFEKDTITPYLRGFTNVNESLMLKSIDEFSQPVYCFYYNHYFDEALPPMVVEDQRAGRDLTIDSVFTVAIGETMTFTKEGLYFFQKDSSSADGITIRVQDKYYPLLKTFEEVLPPLIYISTRSETEKIRNSPNPQQAFEDYWIDLVKIPNLATSTVNKYYERVEAANFLFTTFEEGWKSDMGLIYIIYGPPNDVYKSEEIIDWVYSQDLSMPNIRFSFYKVKNVFTDYHYTLLRKKNYDKNWFKSVELWREGKK